MSLPEPFVLDTDAQNTLNGWLSSMSAKLGRPLQPAQVEYLICTAGAYREQLAREDFRYAALQNLVEFSTAPVLDYLGQLVGVTRLAATAATCTLEFTCVAGHTGVIIPAGTRVRSVDGGAVFLTDAELAISAGVLTGTVSATCEVDGTSGNGYVTGGVNTLQSPIANVISVTNTTASGGGAATESDERLRERIYLAPAQFSTAGSVASYIYHALSAHPDIIDVSVPEDPIPAGTVNIYVLTSGGGAVPGGVIAAVETACSAVKVRPLCDTVLVQGATRVNFAVELDCTVLASAVAGDVLDAAEAAVLAVLDEAKNNIGQDVTHSQLIAAAMVPGMYSVSVVDPSTSVVVGYDEVATYTTIILNLSGTANG